MQITWEKYNSVIILWNDKIEFTFAGGKAMIGTGERPVLASCYICTSYPTRPQPHLSIPVVWDLKSKMKKIIIRNNAHAHTLSYMHSYTHTYTHSLTYCYTWFFLNLDYAQRDRRRRLRALPIRRLYTFFTDCYGEKKRKETITNIVKRTRYDLIHYIIIIIIYYVFVCVISSLLLVARSRIWGVEQGVYAVCSYMLYIHQRLVLDDRLYTNYFFFYTLQNFRRPRLGSFVVDLS